MKPTKSAHLAMASTLEWWGCPGVVYFMAAGNPISAVKIGMLAVTSKTTLASAVKRRLSHIQSSNHEMVELIGLMYFVNGDYPTKQAEDAERELHAKYEHLARFKQYSRGAEWFYPTPELIQHIREISVPPEAHELPRTVAIPRERPSSGA